MENIAYLFGAGASKAALPIANEMENSLRTFNIKYEELVDNYVKENYTKEELINYKRNKEKFSEALLWAADKAKNYGTLDVYANECYYKKDHNNLKKLKSLISTYFIAEQSLNPIDKRYRKYFTEILENKESRKPKIPKNIKIITWNYDTQLEAAYYNFCEDDDVLVDTITENNEQIIRLNGYCAAAINMGHGKEFQAPWKNRGIATIPLCYNLFQYFVNPNKNIEIFLFFAWEHNKGASFLKQLSIKLSEITKLILIGYSMPKLNKEIDEIVFASMKNLNSIDYQVSQDQETDIKEKLENVFPHVNSEKIIYRNDLNSFFIPY